MSGKTPRKIVSGEVGKSKKVANTPPTRASNSEEAVTNRDEQMRALNDKLRLKENEIKMLRESVKSTSVTSSESSVPATKSFRQTKKPPNVGARAPIPPQPIPADKSKIGQAIQQTHKGGMLRVSGLVNVQNNKSKSENPIRMAQTQSTAAIVVDNAHCNRLIQLLAPGVSSWDQLLKKSKALESAFQTCYERVRDNASNMIDLGTLGCQCGSPELYRTFQELQNTYTDLCKKDMRAAGDGKVVQRFLAMNMRILGLFRSLLSSSDTQSIRKTSYAAQVQVIVVQELKSAIARVQALLLEIKHALSNESVQAVEQGARSWTPVAECLSAVQCALGDLQSQLLSRTQHQHRTEGDHDRHCESDIGAVWQYYQCAARLAPWSGATFKSMASLCRHSCLDSFETTFWLVKGLAAEEPHSGARESLLGLFESQRFAAEKLPAITALSRLTADDHILRFRLHFVSCLGIAYTRTGADCFAMTLEKCRRHLAAVLHLLATESRATEQHAQSLNQSQGQGSKKQSHFYDMKLPSYRAPSSELPDAKTLSHSLMELVTAIDTSVCRCVVMCISLLHVLASKYGFTDLINSWKWSLTGASAMVSDPEGADLCVRRFMVQSLFKLQSIPGFLDLSRILLGLMGSLMGSDGSSVATVNPLELPALRTAAILRPLSIFLQWLDKLPQYHVLTLTDPMSWEQMEQSVAKVNISLRSVVISPAALGSAQCEELMCLLPDCGGKNQYDRTPKDICHQIDLSSESSDNVDFSVSLCVVRDMTARLGSTVVLVGNGEQDHSDAIAFTSDRSAVSSSLSSNQQHLMVLNLPSPQCCTVDFQGFDGPKNGPKLFSIEDMNKVLDEDDDDDDDDYDDDEQQTAPAEDSPADHNDDHDDDHLEDIEFSKLIEEIRSSSIIDSVAESPAITESKPVVDTKSASVTMAQPQASRGLLRVKPDQSNKIKKQQKKYAQKGLSAPQNISQSHMHAGSKGASADLPLIVIDVPNVAMRHGLNAKFSCTGIRLVLEFFRSAGHRVIGFLPDHYLNLEKINKLRVTAKLNISDVRAAQVPDDVTILQQLVAEGSLIGTPAQDYDDSYCLTYAQQHNAFIISNDMYRDHVEKLKTNKEAVKAWIRRHVITYTFVQDEFLPNPDAQFHTS